VEVDVSIQVEAPAGRVPLVVEIRCRSHLLELAVRGSLDATTGRALLNDLCAAHEPGIREVHVDLAAVDAIDRDGVLALDRCRSLAAARGARFRITELSRTFRTLDLRDPVSSP
jgi:anti-anti-sigma regulatory factor